MKKAFSRKTSVKNMFKGLFSTFMYLQEVVEFYAYIKRLVCFLLFKISMLMFITKPIYLQRFLFIYDNYNKFISMLYALL